MKLPIKVRIGPFEYKIIFLHHDVADAKSAFGTCCVDEQIIKIDDRCTKDRMQETILHEVMHALWHVQAIPIHDELIKMTEGGLEENIVVRMAMGLIAFAKDNPELWKQLSKRKRA